MRTAKQIYTTLKHLPQKFHQDLLVKSYLIFDTRNDNNSQDIYRNDNIVRLVEVNQQ